MDVPKILILTHIPYLIACIIAIAKLREFKKHLIRLGESIGR